MQRKLLRICQLAGLRVMGEHGYPKLQSKLSLVMMFLLFSSAVSAQINVSGRVTDETNQPLIGVTVTVKNVRGGTQTDANGRYTLSVPNASSVLLFRYIGYQNREVTIGSQTVVNIQMAAAGGEALEEVVVVAYGTQKKATISGAISNIQAADIVRTPAVAATSALAGKIPGVTARTTDARPGNGANLQIRNLGNPLYVIDGVAYSTSNGQDAFGYNTGISGVNAFNQIGIDDIESITVLKDASASIYGLAAGNGVVLVTTKRGKRGDKPTLGVSGYYGLQNFTRFPKPGNAGQYIRGRLESEQNLGNNPANLYSPQDLAKWEAGVEPGYQSFDYYDFVVRPNVPQYYLTANASGGTEKSTYYLSLGHLNQDATIKDFNFNRTNLQANISSNILKGLTVGAQISGRIEDRHNVGVPGLDDFFNPLLSIGSMWPTETPYANNNPNYINQTHNVNVNPATYRDDVTGYIDNVTRGGGAKFTAQYDFNFGLTAKGLYSYDYSNEDFEGFEYTYPAYIYDPATDTYNDRAPNGALYGNQNPWRERHKRNVIAKFTQFQLNYNKQIKDHSISALAAFERREATNDYLALHSVPPNNIIPTQVFADLDYIGDTHYEEAFEGYAMRLNYDYKKKYLIEAVGRYDGSFLYRSDSRFGFFPGVSVGWRISEEGFFKKVFSDKVNELKIRASYGETGTSLQDAGNGNYINPSPFDYLTGYNVNAGNAVLDGTFYNGVVPRGLPITTLSWLTNETSNVGIDFTVFRHFTGQFDLFRRKRSGLPSRRYDVLLPSEVGYLLPNENLNSDVTQGFDGFLTYSNKIGQVEFSLGGNATLGRTKNDYLYKERFGNSYDQYRNGGSGRWQGVNWGHHIVGRFQSQQEINDHPVNIDNQGNTSLLPGDLIYEDLNGDGIINHLDLKPIGYAEGALPYFNYGINGRVGFKGFSLAFDFMGAGMQTYFRDWELKYPFQNNGNSPAYMLTDRWHRADPFDPDSEWIPGTYPALRKDRTTNSVFRSPISNSDRNDFWTTNIRYLRLKNLELGYTFPKALVQKVNISGLRIYVNGSNLFSFDNVKEFEIDPEISATNGLIYPQQKIYTFGFNLTL